jgi:hypothetical protein
LRQVSHLPHPLGRNRDTVANLEIVDIGPTTGHLASPRRNARSAKDCRLTKVTKPLVWTAALLRLFEDPSDQSVQSLRGAPTLE